MGGAEWMGEGYNKKTAERMRAAQPKTKMMMMMMMMMMQYYPKLQSWIQKEFRRRR